jgi:AcrR family transcriptional regulator
MAARQKMHGDTLSAAGETVAYSGPEGTVARAGDKLAKAGKASRGRRIAGQDPVKRDQILDGARRCFLERGFDATSMNDITSQSGVSKGTLYVYFEDKEDLIGALIDRERRRTLDFARERLDESSSIEQALTDFGATIATTLTSRDVVRAMRMVLGVAENRPALAAKFFGAEPFSGVEVIKDYLDRKVAEGELAIPDTGLAGRQFIDLAMAGIFKRRLFGYMPEEATQEEIATSVRSAVEMFLGYYRRPKAD